MVNIGVRIVLGNGKLNIKLANQEAQKRKGECLSDVYKNNKQKLIWRCQKGHIFYTCLDRVRNNGSWCPNQICKNERMVQTSLKNFGVSSPIQHPIISLKISKSSNNSGVILHWKDGQELIWQASYEKIVIETLNELNVNFIWKQKKFTTNIIGKNGQFRTYEPDLYFPDKDLWIEIKGYKRKSGMEKWEWFHKEYPNSELWDRKRLKEMGYKIK